MKAAVWNPNAEIFLRAQPSPNSASPPVGDRERREWVRGLFAIEPRRWLRRLPARETFAWRPAEGEVLLVVKRSARGGLADALWDLARLRRPRSAGEREDAALRALARLSVPVPRAVAWAAGAGARLGLGRSAVVMEHVEHEEDLRRVLAAADAPTLRRLGEQLSGLTARLHAAGWYHRDLYLGHFVLAARTGRPVLLDVGRARHEARPRRRWFVKDLAALLHSAPRAVGPAARLRFLSRYLTARGVPRGIAGRRERRSWARAVQRKAARIAAHAPRHDPPLEDL